MNASLNQSIERDIVICGGGFSGLSAAVSALEAGASVTLIEKAPGLGGSAMISGGLIWTFSTYERIRNDISHGDAALQWLVYDAFDTALAWLADCGVKLGPEGPVLGHGRGRIMDPAQAIGCLAERFATLGGTLLLDTALESLVTRDGVVCGVRAVLDGGPIELLSRAVILATGGFHGNPELLTRYILSDPDNLVLRGNSWSTGDGFIAATAAGAAASPGIDTFYGHALTVEPARYSRLEFRDASQYYGQSSVALNLDGERFCDESDGNGEEIINQHLARQKRGRGFYIIDQAVLDSMPIQGIEVVTKAIVDRARAFGTPFVEAATLEELCRGLAQFGIPEAIALKTLQEFNALVGTGRADELKPSRLGRRTLLNAPPFYAIGVQAAITFTMGGLRIDERTRVLRRAGSTSTMAETPRSRAFMETDGRTLSIGSDYRQMPIRGLLAVGCDAGNISHFGYMGGLATALTTGRTAGLEAAGTTRKSVALAEKP